MSSRATARSNRGLPGAQDDLAALEQASTLVAEYQPHLVPGLAQTAAYATTWLIQPDRPTSLDVDGVVRARPARQAILYQPDHHVVIALGEAALRTIHGNPDVQRQQPGHLHVIAGLPTVELLVKPAATAMAVMRELEVLEDRLILEDADGARHLTEHSVAARFVTPSTPYATEPPQAPTQPHSSQESNKASKIHADNPVDHAVLTARASALGTPPFRAHNEHNGRKHYFRHISLLRLPAGSA